MYIYYETLKTLKIKIIDINILFEKLEVLKNKIIDTEILIKNVQDEKLILERLQFTNHKDIDKNLLKHKELQNKLNFLYNEIIDYHNDMKKLIIDI